MNLAADAAHLAQGGEVFALYGELGAGKTTFVKGLAAGLGFQQPVTSPTFNLVHYYRGGRLDLVHYDLYRLKRLEEVEALDLEQELSQENVLAIEWPKLVEPLLPDSRTYRVVFAETQDGAWRVSMTNP